MSKKIIIQEYNYCPDCVIELVGEVRQFGSCKLWKVCPNCGMRIRKVDIFNFISSVPSLKEAEKNINNDDI